jgi:integrase
MKVAGSVVALKRRRGFLTHAAIEALRTVTLRRRSNRDMGRDREHLTEHEVERLIRITKGNRYGHRDATMILIGFRHGLRVSELCQLQWSSIEFETATMHVRRVKGGQEATLVASRPATGGAARSSHHLRSALITRPINSFVATGSSHRKTATMPLSGSIQVQLPPAPIAKKLCGDALE